MARDAMAEMALRYPGGPTRRQLREIRRAVRPHAYRFENGVRMAGPGCTFQPPSCENMRSQQLPTLAGIVAHVVAVDEENATVLLWMDFGPARCRGRPNAAPRSLVTFEAFKIYGGQVHAVEAIFEGMPNGTASGWR